MNVRFIGGWALALLFIPAQAHDYALSKIKISHPWARATPPAAQVGGGYMKLENTGSSDRLVAVSANVSNAVELHSMTMQGDVMYMRKLDNGIDLPSGQTVELKPGGLHIMFSGLKAPLKEGNTFPLVLKFEKAGEITVSIKVDRMGAAAPGDHDQM